MSSQQKNITATLIAFTLILVFFVVRVTQLVREGNFNEENVFWLWGIVVVLAVIGTIITIILTHIGSSIVEAARTGQEPKTDDIEDERDRLIDLRGTRVTYFVTSIGGLVAMLTFVLGQSPLVMFSLFILFGLVGQVVGDASRLYMYQRGF